MKLLFNARIPSLKSGGSSDEEKNSSRFGLLFFNEFLLSDIPEIRLKLPS